MGIFTRWHNYHHHPVLEQFHPPAQIPHGHLQLIISHPHPWAITDLLSISTNLPLLDISYQCNHVICGLHFWLLSLNIRFLKFIHGVVYVSSFFFFHYSIPLIECTTFYLPIHLQTFCGPHTLSLCNSATLCKHFRGSFLSANSRGFCYWMSSNMPTH